MPKIIRLLHFTVLAAIVLSLVSCDGDDDKIDSIVGTWHGIHSSVSPSGSTRYAYLDVEFKSDKTGWLEYDAPSIYSYGMFKYTISGNLIKCKGAYANSNGDAESDFTLDFRIEGDRLIPTSRFTQFVLTRDGSVTDTGDGGGSSSSQDASIESLIKSDVSVKQSYSRYFITFEITSTLKSKMPNGNYKFAIGHSYRGADPKVYIITSNYEYSKKLYTYTSTTIGDTEKVTIKYPFWWFTYARDLTTDVCAECQSYYAALIALEEKGSANWFESERNLYPQLIKYLDDELTDAKRYYTPYVVLQYNNKNYNVASFSNFWN